jgi:hypothetical protein
MAVRERRFFLPVQGRYSRLGTARNNSRRRSIAAMQESCGTLGALCLELAVVA